MRQGKDFYSDKYEKARMLHKEGKSVNEIANELGISYSHNLIDVQSEPDRN